MSARIPQAMQSRDSPSAADARASAAGGGGGLGAPPAGAGLRPNLAATRTKGFGGQSAPQGRSAVSQPAAVVLLCAGLFWLEVCRVTWATGTVDGIVLIKFCSACVCVFCSLWTYQEEVKPTTHTPFCPLTQP